MGQAVALVVLVGQVEGEREDPGVMTTTRIARPARVRTVRVEDFKRRREQRPRRLPRRRLLHSTHQSAPAPQLSAKPASNYGRDTPGQVAPARTPSLLQLEVQWSQRCPGALAMWTCSGPSWCAVKVLSRCQHKMRSSHFRARYVTQLQLQLQVPAPFPTQQRLVPTACEQEGDLVVLLGATGGRGVEQPRAWTA